MYLNKEFSFEGDMKVYDTIMMIRGSQMLLSCVKLQKESQHTHLLIRNISNLYIKQCKYISSFSH